MTETRAIDPKRYSDERPTLREIMSDVTEATVFRIKEIFELDQPPDWDLIARLPRTRPWPRH